MNDSPPICYLPAFSMLDYTGITHKSSLQNTTVGKSPSDMLYFRRVNNLPERSVMAITFYPDHGTILMCDFNTGFKAPEMVKKRPVVVVSPRRNNSQLCTIVPLSSVQPRPIQDHHHRMDIASMPESLIEKESWAKCDMLMTVSLERLDRVADGRGTNNKRKYVSKKITPGDFKAIRTGILYALGLNSLAGHLP